MFVMGWMSFLSPNQQCQSTEENSKHWVQAAKITHGPHPFYTHQQSPDGSSNAPFMPALLCQHPKNIP